MAEGGILLPEGTIKCGCCSKNPVFTHHCDKCKEICERCADIHKELRQGILKEHNVMPIDTKSVYCHTYKELPGVRTHVEVDEDQKFIMSTVVTQTRVCSWNVNNDKSNEAEARKAVNMATFKVSQMPDGTYLKESDIICVQEMTVDPTSVKKARKYLPFVGDHELYDVVASKETTIYNAVFYNNFKFGCDESYEEYCLNFAYDLCEKKRKYCYNCLRKIYDSYQELIVKECYETGCDLDKIKERYPKDHEVTVKRRLKERMAICVLVDKSTEHYTVALSVHNYHTSEGEEGRRDYAILLFDFLENIQYTDLRHTGYTVVIGGDFNFNILKHKDPCLQRYLKQYDIPPYELRPLRQDDGKIDFILVSKPNQGSKFSTLVDGEVKAYDLVPEDYQTLANLNHNPLSVSIEFHTPTV